MRVKFDGQLQLLNTEMIQMGHMIENAIRESIEAFFCQDVGKAGRIMQDDDLIDREQKKIENICFQLLIQQQPVARDLRTITAAMKMVTDMERIGDHAADISWLTTMMADGPYLLKPDHSRKNGVRMGHTTFDIPDVFSHCNLRYIQRVLDFFGHRVHNHKAAELRFLQQRLCYVLILHDGKNFHHGSRQDHDAHTGQPAILERIHPFSISNGKDMICF